MPAIAKKLFTENQEILDYLHKSRLFGHLPEELLEKLVPLSQILKAPPGTYLLTEGQPNDQVFFLIRGEVGVYAAGEMILKLRRIGDIFGEMSVISDKPCSASVKAETQVTLFCFHSREVGTYSELAPDELQNILYRVFAMILTEKLSLTTHKAKQFEATNRTLQEVQENLKSSNKDLARLNDEFRLFVPKQFIERMIVEQGHTPAKAFKPGHLLKEEEVTILFSDIRSFSTVSEQMTSEETFDFLNSFLKVMEPCILENNGFIDKFIGDAIMAIFQSADEAVQAALDMEEAVEHFNENRTSKKQIPIGFGIGINTGLVMTGLLGTQNRLQSTVIGDTVNLASRLEGLTKEYGIRILISEYTQSQLTTTHDVRMIDHVLVRGRRKELFIYEIFGSDSPELLNKKKESLDLFNQAFQLYLDSSFQEAMDLFHRCYRQCQQDLVSRMYVFRCAHFLNHPPANDWNGVFQNRATRYHLGDLPAKLFFELGDKEDNHMAIMVRNISQTGASIIIGDNNDLYNGENLVVEIAFQNLIKEQDDDQTILKVPCQVQRRNALSQSDFSFFEFGLKFNGLNREQTLLLEEALQKLD